MGSKTADRTVWRQRLLAVMEKKVAGEQIVEAANEPGGERVSETAEDVVRWLPVFKTRVALIHRGRDLVNGECERQRETLSLTLRRGLH